MYHKYGDLRNLDLDDMVNCHRDGPLKKPYLDFCERWVCFVLMSHHIIKYPMVWCKIGHGRAPEEENKHHSLAVELLESTMQLESLLRV